MNETRENETKFQRSKVGRGVLGDREEGNEGRRWWWIIMMIMKESRTDKNY